MSRLILVVDDEPNIALSLEFLLSQAGYEVCVAHDGEAALEVIEDRKPDMVLLDVMLPKRGGFEVCETIRANPKWSGILVIMLTAKGRHSERERGLAVGADAYITKPFSNRDVIQTVKSFLDSKNTRK